MSPNHDFLFKFPVQASWACPEFFRLLKSKFGINAGCSESCKASCTPCYILLLDFLLLLNSSELRNPCFSLYSTSHGSHHKSTTPRNPLRYQLQVNPISLKELGPGQHLKQISFTKQAQTHCSAQIPKQAV